MRTVAQVLSGAITARKNCIENSNVEWLHRHEETIASITRNALPRGSGVDNGCVVDLDKSGSDKIVITCGYHHMNEHGYYCGWTEHTITVLPSFDGINVHVGGKNKNDIKEYLGDLFHDALTQEIDG